MVADLFLLGVFSFGFLFVDLLLEFCESGTTFSQNVAVKESLEHGL